MATGAFTVGMIRKKFDIFEKIQGRHTILLADLDRRMQKQEGEVCHAQDVFNGIERKIDKIADRVQEFGDKLHEVAEENVESHANIIAGRSSLIERLASLEARIGRGRG